ncbi:MAG: tetratricopeptide repeat protein [Deltaproteobacteria bacterium]|nr:tetratricopeptide repeat protein [Deltaproteobacteria bacterium]
MAKKFCFHHPARLAHWTCPKCATAYCPDCILKRDKGGFPRPDFVYMCPKCIMPAVWIGAENLIEPFWTRLRSIFLYPFSLWPLILMAILALVDSLFVGRSLFGLLVSVAIWAVLIKYSYAILVRTAHGGMTPPRLAAETLSTDLQDVFKQYGLFVILGFVGYNVVRYLGPLMLIPFGIFVFICMPAMIITLAATNSLLQAVNPVTTARLISRLGRGYFIMFFFLLLLGGAPSALYYSFVSYLPAALAAFLIGLITSYYTMVSYHLMGYVLLQYHKEIGYTVDFEDFVLAPPKPAAQKAKAAKKEPEKADPLVLEVNQLLRDSKLEEALELIREKPGAEILSSPALAEVYYRILKAKKLTADLLAFGPDYLDALVKFNEKQKALAVFTELQALAPDFKAAADTAYTLAGWMNDLGQTQRASDAYRQFIAAYPDDPAAPKAYFRAAQILHDRLFKMDEAKALLRELSERHPSHAIMADVNSYMRSISAPGGR